MIPHKVIDVQPFSATVCAGCSKSPKLGKLYIFSEGGPQVCSPRCHRAHEQAQRKAFRKRPENGERVALVALCNTTDTVASELRGWAGELSACAAGHHPGDLARVEQIATALASTARLLDRDTANAREEIRS